ncbi:MAG: M20/M25/M40 family metallo-hydrolase, partial [Firmicutes bacterium]|nr:M20/M25/M40 family metallo-hydrolase [Bacillota bacterium]
MSNLKEALKAYISEERVVKMTEDMIRIESYYGIPNQETGVAKYIKSMFDASGIPCELKEVADGRCNVIATLDSGVPGKTMMFNGHLDTVEPNGWEEAFEPRIVDGIMYGRGTCDDKGPTAGLIEAMLALKESGELKKGKIVFTGVLDEEHNSIGTIDVIESGIQADAAIVAERSFFEIRNCQRGLEWLKFHFTGKTVHGGYLHDGINAISKANKYINAVEQKLAPKIFGRKHPTLNEA